MPKLATQISDNRMRIHEQFQHCSDFTYLPWYYGPDQQYEAFSVYLDSMVHPKQVNYMRETLQDLILDQTSRESLITRENIIDFFEQNGVSSQPTKLVTDIDEALEFILNGYVLIFFDGWNKALAYEANHVEKRQVSEPVTEPVVQGPHISTIESVGTNIGLIRALLKTTNLKFHQFTAGTESKRIIVYGYLDGAVNPEVLTDFQHRIEQINEEEIMETSYLEEWIGDHPYTPFPMVRYTERPDTAVAALLDGKIIALVDGTPTVLICPGQFFEFFASSEDYYQEPAYSSLVRILRIAAFFISLFLPSTYIALSTFHSELIPTVLLMAILSSREEIPFPALVEALLMEFFFEMLREAGIRLPRPIGSAVSIVGALVIGQAAIQAKIASPVMIIVVALTGIASFSFPQYSMATAIRVLRFPFMILAATFGGLGIMFGFVLALLHLTCLNSLGQPYLSPAAPFELKSFRDIVISIPRKILLHSPRNRHLHRKTNDERK